MLHIHYLVLQSWLIGLTVIAVVNYVRYIGNCNL